MAKRISKRKAKKLRKNGDLRAPMAKVGYGPIQYSGAGKHENKKRKALNKLAKKELSF